MTVSAVRAAPVSYNEQVDGDLAFLAALPLLPFDVGLNTVTGTFGHIFENPPTDYDSFAFTIPANAQLVAADVILRDDLGNISGALWRLRQGSDAWEAGALLEEVQGSSPGVTVFTAPPLGPDTYNVSQINFGFFGQNNSNTADYVFSFQVESVPEPSAFVLAALALLGLGRRAVLIRHR